MEKQFLVNLKEKTDINKGDRILVAVSGGMDSVLLLYLLHKYKEELGLELEAAHVNHLLRGKDSKRDQEFVKELAGRLEIPFHTIEIDVMEISALNKWTVEEGARKLRYEYLRDLMAATGSSKIAVAHHNKDQAETILMHLIRGTGTEGLRGMFFDKDDIIRPLLDITREQIEAKIEELGLEYRTDKTNHKTRYARNKIRLKLLPELKKYNPGIEENLSRTGEIIRTENSFIEAEADNHYKALVNIGEEHLTIGEELLLLHPALRRRIIIRAYKELTRKYLEHVHVLAADDYIRKKQKNKLGLPNNVRLYVKDSLVNLDMRKKSTDIIDEVLVIKEPGIYEFAGRKIIVKILAERPDEEVYVSRNSNEGFLDLDKIKWPIKVRTRREKDVFRVMGKSEPRKLKKLLIDRKTDAALRNSLPLFLADDGEILFIPGIGVSEIAKIEEKTVTILHFSII